MQIALVIAWDFLVASIKLPHASVADGGKSPQNMFHIQVKAGDWRKNKDVFLEPILCLKTSKCFFGWQTMVTESLQETRTECLERPSRIQTHRDLHVELDPIWIEFGHVSVFLARCAQLWNRIWSRKLHYMDSKRTDAGSSENPLWQNPEKISPRDPAAAIPISNPVLKDDTFSRLCFSHRKTDINDTHTHTHNVCLCTLECKQGLRISRLFWNGTCIRKENWSAFSLLLAFFAKAWGRFLCTEKASTKSLRSI